MNTLLLSFTLYACQFGGGPLWTGSTTTYKGYIAPGEAAPGLAPVIHLVEDKIASEAYSAGIWGLTTSDGRTGLVLNLYAPLSDDPIATQYIDDLSDPSQSIGLTQVHRRAGSVPSVYSVHCAPVGANP